MVLTTFRILATKNHKICFKTTLYVYIIVIDHSFCELFEASLVAFSCIPKVSKSHDKN